MSKTEEASPLEAAPGDVAPQTDATAAAANDVARANEEAGASDALPPRDALSPAVRRLVRQFDLDVTGIHGTGPEGRIRVGDVMGLLTGRTDTGNRDAPPRGAVEAVAEAADADAEPESGAERSPPLDAASHGARQPGAAVTSVFECDFSRVLSHRKRLRRENAEMLTLVSYVLSALASALEAAPELAAGTPARFGVWLTTADGELRSSLVELPTALPEDLGERARALDAALRTNLDFDVTGANLLVHSYGESGSVLATPTAIGAGHAASIGVGRVRRELVVRTVDGVETPRVAARCYLTISFYAERIAFNRANRALAETVRILENWPE
jgi:pyruvate/2-oxoglutarate dehydrogenase complex dihydrolipoamide acyltransferase (E2) component